MGLADGVAMGCCYFLLDCSAQSAELELGVPGMFPLKRNEKTSGAGVLYLSQQSFTFFCKVILLVGSCWLLGNGHG